MLFSYSKKWAVTLHYNYIHYRILCFSDFMFFSADNFNASPVFHSLSMAEKEGNCGHLQHPKSEALCSLLSLTVPAVIKSWRQNISLEMQNDSRKTMKH